MKALKKFNSLLALLLVFNLPGQNEFSKWYFGDGAGLDFSTSPPTVLNGPINTVEGVAIYCDAGGNVLLSSDGTVIYNGANSMMANGYGLNGHYSSTQSALIVKQPGNNPFYYVFTTYYVGGSAGACYSIVDMSLAAGMGSVTVKNALLYTPSTEKQVAVRHCNGKDIWIINHAFNSADFKAWLLTSTGLSATPVVSTIGDVMNTLNGMGQLKVSPDGKRLAMAALSMAYPASLGSGGFQLFDFDAATGTISNSLTVLTCSDIPTMAPYGVEFSPDGTKLYGAAEGSSSTNTSGFFQWNLCAGSNAAISASQYSIDLGSVIAGSVQIGSVQRAIDGKLYLSVYKQQALGVINNPNASGAAMGFTINGQSVGTNSCMLGLPNFINGYTHQAPAQFTHNVACQTLFFTASSAASSSATGCGVNGVPYPYTSYLWDFGEPAAGVANSSTLANPVHTYSSTGTYTISLILYSACTSDTLHKVITLVTPEPTLAVAGNFTVCNGEKHTYTVSGASSYSWSAGSTATAIPLSPSTTTVYSVSGTLNGCTVSKTFTVTVNPCTGISELESSGAFQVYPNPFRNVLNVDATEISDLMIFDVNGNLMRQSQLQPGRNEINTSSLPAGIYLVKAGLLNGRSWQGRFVKME